MKQRITLMESQLRGYVESMVRESLYRLIQEQRLDEGKLARALGAAALGAGLMFGNPQDANAQLNVKTQIRTQPEKICNLSMQVNLFKEDDGYKIRLQACGLEQGERTTRQLQQTGGGLTGLIGSTALRQAEKQNSLGIGQTLSIYLGNTEDSVIESLNQLAELVNNQVHETQVSQNDGDIVLTNNTSKMYPKGLWVTQDGIEGYNILPLNAIKKALQYFEGTYKLTSSDFEKSWDEQYDENAGEGEQDEAPEFTEYRKLKAYLRNAKTELNAAYNSYDQDPDYIRIKKEQIKKIQARMKEIENMYAQKGQKIQ